MTVMCHTSERTRHRLATEVVGAGRLQGGNQGGDGWPWLALPLGWGTGTSCYGDKQPACGQPAAPFHKITAGAPGWAPPPWPLHSRGSMCLVGTRRRATWKSSQLASPRELQPSQPVRVVGTRPHLPPSVAPRAEPTPRPTRHLLAVGRLQVVVVHHAPAPPRLGHEPRTRLAGAGGGWLRRPPSRRYSAVP
jgi:hypothetical protein